MFGLWGKEVSDDLKKLMQHASDPLAFAEDFRASVCVALQRGNADLLMHAMLSCDRGPDVVFPQNRLAPAHVQLTRAEAAANASMGNSRPPPALGDTIVQSVLAPPTTILRDAEHPQQQARAQPERRLNNSQSEALVPDNLLDDVALLVRGADDIDTDESLDETFDLHGNLASDPSAVGRSVPFLVNGYRPLGPAVFSGSLASLSSFGPSGSANRASAATPPASSGDLPEYIASASSAPPRAFANTLPLSLSFVPLRSSGRISS